MRCNERSEAVTGCSFVRPQRYPLRVAELGVVRHHKSGFQVVAMAKPKVYEGSWLRGYFRFIATGTALNPPSSLFRSEMN